MRRIAHISDLHFGTTDLRLVDGLRADLLEFNFDLLVVTGDLTQRAKRTQYEQCMEFLSSLPNRQLVVPGNHDIEPVYRPWLRLFDPYRSYRRYVTPELDQVYADDEVFVIGLNTVDPMRWQEGTVSRDQLVWLEAKAAGRTPSQLSILAAHHPLAHLETTGLRHHIRHNASLLELLDRLAFDLVLTGHLHQSYSGIAATSFSPSSRLLVAQASTATSTRVRGHLNGYNRIIVDPPTLSVELRTWNGGAFATERTGRFEHAAAEAMAARSSSPTPSTSVARLSWRSTLTQASPPSVGIPQANPKAASNRT
jgi:3',5'-cyclic AMP phosphodiesterase CpdA